LSASRAIVTLLRAYGEDGEILVRLFNPSAEPDEVRFASRGGAAAASIVRTDPWGESPAQNRDAAPVATDGRVAVGAREVATFRVQP
jgi:hypothetical protein